MNFFTKNPNVKNNLYFGFSRGGGGVGARVIDFY